MTTGRTNAAPRPTAGALRLVEASTTRPRSVDISDYARQMTAHCPYLAPSLREGLTTWTVYRADGDAEAVQAELLHAWCVVGQKRWGGGDGAGAQAAPRSRLNMIGA